MKNLLLTTFLMLLSISLTQAQQNIEKKDKNQKQERLIVKVKEKGKPDVYVNGKKFDFPIEIIDQSKIESVSVLKNELATKEYNAPNGVILIKTKKEKESAIFNFNTSGIKKNPMIIIDGKVTDKKILEILSPGNIESISIIKDKQAMKKYNATNGVIIVTTKKKN